jgi:hypothetical protein
VKLGAGCPIVAGMTMVFKWVEKMNLTIFINYLLNNLKIKWFKQSK